MDDIRITADTVRAQTLVETLIRMDGVRRGVQVAGLYVRGQVSVYAPQPAGVDYVRTGNLGRRWTSKETGLNGLTARVGNNAYYADDVQGSQSGSPYFKRVWGNHSIGAVARRETPRVVDIIQNEIRRSLP